MESMSTEPDTGGLLLRPKSVQLVPVIFEKDEEPPEPSRGGEKCYACIVSKKEKPELASALEEMGLEVCYSETGRKLPANVPDECRIVFVCEQFSGPDYERLVDKKFRVVGQPCVLSCRLRNKPLAPSVRPTYSCSMEGTVICFTGFKDKEMLHSVCSKAHLMGASIRKDMTSSVTHVVAHSVSGSKYKVAVGLGTPIMSEQWVNECWAHRDNIHINAHSPDMMLHKQLPFAGCHIALEGYPDDEARHMRDIATDNGGMNGELGDAGLTHLVVADTVDPSEIPVTSSRVLVVKQQWFWESIQIEACADEALYQAKESAHSRHSRQKASFNSSLHTSIDISFLEASLYSLASPGMKGLGKREARKLACSSTSTPTKGAGPPNTARYHIAAELLQTEKNFVNILSLIVKVFKEPVERPQQRGGAILSAEDSKSIFGNIPEILTVHQNIVRGLEELMAHWEESTSIGAVLLLQSDELLRVYPPFVNFFEMSKEALARCERVYPRFHAFLKVSESRSECSRQKLSELLITPVQRIPRIILLLQDLLKHTDPHHNDHSTLQQAVDSLKNVMTHINEDKRKTESQMQMFEVLRDIEDCPATVLSSHRQFLRRLDLLDISRGHSRGDPLALYIFSDSMEIARRRPSGFGMKTATKPFKHLEFLPYTYIRSIINFEDTEDVSGGFGLLVQWPEDPQEKLLVFGPENEDSSKSETVRHLAKLMADAHFSTDPDQFVVSCSADVIHSLSRSANSTTIHRALQYGLTLPPPPPNVLCLYLQWCQEEGEESILQS
ncbi:Protein ECT2 [Geodia barretti]|uniref:Protein ECT2 n=1 Tax=Geodia barretti TaxID=519541 RepID=A0AA35R464_GEOBA|nr:Protein ECT2 [Geodia barretti]